MGIVICGVEEDLCGARKSGQVRGSVPMTAAALHADTFKGVLCAIHPYIKDMDLAQQKSGHVELEEIHHCIHRVQGLLKEEDGVLEEFCHQADPYLLQCVCELCLYMWPKLRFEERGLA
jgi:hypothetical protein